jgi:DNA-binding HxlR family transcriptional regulator
MSPRLTQNVAIVAGLGESSGREADVPPLPIQRQREGGASIAPLHPKSHDENPLALREVLNRVGDKWSIEVVRRIDRGPRRFGHLLREIQGVSQRMLTLTLKGLERDGLVTRTVFPTVPRRVEYELTSLGKTLLDSVRVLARWAEKNRFEILDARGRFDETAERVRATGK